MKVMMAISLLVNIAVLVPVCIGLMTTAGWVRAGYGEATPARAILLSVYLAIAVASALLLVFRNGQAVAALLFVQVIYKLTTPLTVGTLHNPVVLSNLGIAALHAVTLTVIWRTSRRPLAAR